MREKDAEGVVNFVFVSSENQLADIFTKVLTLSRFMVLVHNVQGVYEYDLFVYDHDSVAEMYDMTMSTRFWRFKSALLHL